MERSAERRRSFPLIVALFPLLLPPARPVPLTASLTSPFCTMDVADLRVGQNDRVRDELSEKCQKCFRDFLSEFADEEGSKEPKYLEDALDLVQPDRSTLFVNFADLERFDQRVATLILEQYFRVYPYLCRGQSPLQPCCLVTRTDRLIACV